MALGNLINVVVTGPPIEVTVEKVEEAYKRLKNNMGPGGIPAELMEYGTTKSYTHIQRLVKDCLNGAEVPKE